MKSTCKRLTALVLALSMCLSLLCTTAWAVDETGEADAAVSAQDTETTDTTEVQLTVTYGQSEAREMLDLVNDFRTGDDAWYWNEDDTTKTTCTDLSELTYDYTLEAVAMQRAAELALSFSHTRPDGTSCDTAYTEAGYEWKVTLFAYGENIAVGYETAEEAVEAWKETDENYAGQGHRRNMLSSSYTAVGIGHVVYNGIDYWVQDFGHPMTLNTTATTANNSETTVSINVATSYIESVSLSADPTSYSLTCGKSSALPELTASLSLTDVWPEGSEITVTVSADWTSGNTSYATVADGKVTGVTSGSTTLTASALGETVSVSVQVNHSYQAVVTAPTCTEKGYTTYTCSGCGTTFTSGETDATGHSYDAGVVTTEATCINEGVMTYTCTDCGHSYTEAIPTTDHTYNAGVVTTEATCEENGERTYTCTVCGHSYTEAISATGHSYKAVVTAPTCTEKGYTTYTCSNCGNTYTDDETDATGHSYDEGVVTKEATCEENGERTYTCTVCGHSYTEAIPATDHTYGDPVFTWAEDYSTATATFTCEDGDSTIKVTAEVTAQTTQPTCTEKGKTVYTATAHFNGEVYTDTQTEAIEATGHDYEAVVTAPTCTMKGYTTYTCSVCGDSYVADETEATGHSHDSGTVTTEATCTEDGVMTYTCTVCGDTYTEAIPATGHSYEAVVTAPTCTEKGYTTYTCSACGDSYVADETDALGHTWDSGVVTKEATEEEDGERTYTCTVCGATKTEVIPAITHTFGAPVFTWAKDYSSATATFTCEDEDCDRTVEQSAEVTVKTTQPTCTEDGKTVYTATVSLNGETYTDTKTETISATGHSYDEGVVTDPTCTEKGCTTYTCTVCGNTYTGNETAALGHSYDSGTVTKEATCTENGVMTYICTVCGSAYTEAIPATGHSYENGVCTVCGAKEPIDLSDCTISLAETTYTYDGTAKVPAVTVQDAEGNTLTEGVDYTVSYSDNTAAGTAAVTVTGIGSYTGTATATFTIEEAAQEPSSGTSGDQSDADEQTAPAATKITSAINRAKGIKLTWNAVDGATSYQVYRKIGNGSWKKVKTTSSTTWLDSAARKNGTKYQYKVYAVNDAGKSKASATKKIYRLTAKHFTRAKNVSGKKISLKWTRNTRATGYIIQYSTSKSFTGSTTKTIKIKGNKNLTTTLKNLKKGKTYYIRMRPYKTSGSLTSYAGWSKVKTVKVKK